MKTNPRLKAVILEVVDNQIRDNKPPETRQTFNHLMNEGFSEGEVRRLIGCVVSTEIFNVLKKKEKFDHKRFVEALNKLPELPWE